MKKKVFNKLNFRYWHQYLIKIGTTCNETLKSAQELFL